MQVAYVEYTGDGQEDKAITGAGFAPDMAICLAAGAIPVWRTDDMAANTSMYLGANLAGVADGIKTLTADGCTVGTGAYVNTNLFSYAVLFFKDNEAGDFAFGTYAGNGADERWIDCAGCTTPGLVWVKYTGTRYGIFRCNQCDGDIAHVGGFVADAANLIQNFGASTFQVGDDNHVNQNGLTYYWFALAASALVEVSSYTGNSIDQRDIPTTIAAKAVVIANSSAADHKCFRTEQRGATESVSKLHASIVIDNAIQAMDADSFQVGTFSAVNTDGSIYHWFAFATGTSGAVPSLSLTDGFGLADAVTTRPKLSLSEGLGAAESPVLSPLMSLSDGATFSDLAMLTVKLSLADGMGIDEVLLTTPILTFGDTVNLADIAALSPHLAIAEGLTAADQLTIGQLNLLLADALGLADSVTFVALAAALSLSDGIGLADNLSLIAWQELLKSQGRLAVGLFSSQGRLAVLYLSATADWQQNILKQEASDMRDGISIDGNLIIFDPQTGIREVAKNKCVYAGLDAIVDALVAAGNINSFKYIGFGTTGTTTAADATALIAEVSGGDYARLTATQAEGDNGRIYKLSGTWTNESGETKSIAEVGIFSASTEGTMLARSCVDDDGWSAKSIDDDRKLEIEQWTITLADA